MVTEDVVEAGRTEGPSPRRSVVARGVVAAVTGLLVLGVGLAGGFVAGKQSSAPATGAHGHEAEAEPPGAHAGAPKLSSQTLATLGIEVCELVATEFVRTRDVPAVVVEPAGVRRSAHAPVAGIVRRILVRPGSSVKAGEPVAELVRDPFPRPALALADPVVRVLDEEFHRGIADLRTTSLAHALAKEEQERVGKVLASAGGAGAVPSKTEVDLAREVRRTERALENARMEAHRHGMTQAQVAAIESGSGPAPEAPDMRRVLEVHRLWGAKAEEVLALLPEESRQVPFVIALVGELHASRLLTDELAAALRAHPTLGASFAEVAGLLQAGETVGGVLALEEAGAFASVVAVRAPADAPDWDVVGIEAGLGAHVARGGDVALLLAPQRMALRLVPVGADVTAIESALVAGETLTADPLLDGSGCPLADLHLTRFDVPSEPGGAASALIELENVPLDACVRGGPATRSWRLRAGLRYVVRIPVTRAKDRFVLPAEAVIPRGADSVVILQEGTKFRQVPVHVEYLDARVAVIPAASGGIFAGDVYVRRGAYALSLALQAAAGGGAADPHAGHNH